ncbi:MAG: hypothetical protein IKQ46_10070 [Bacteroidales bacterium]|nr:hypothetical protein [Bacteroidales bacterium]
MIISLNNFDSKRVEQLDDIMKNNGAIFDVLADYVNNNEKFITKEMLMQIVNDYEMNPSMAFAMLISSACGMEIYSNPIHKELFHNYFVPAIKELNPSDYNQDPYLKTIKFPDKLYKNWKFTTTTYSPCEAFIYNDPYQKSDFTEIPQIGFFMEEFKFPAVLENGREWMSVKPNEIETMQIPIENAHGKVLAYGLGLGYFAFMASQKRSVESVTIVEKNPEIIDLFTSELLPQFPNAQKINIINTDAFEYAEKSAPNENYDYTFSDIWHDTGDGLSMYLKLKRLNSKIANCEFDYWIEKSLLSSLRYTVFGQLYKIFKSKGSSPAQPGEKIVKTYQELVNMISDNGLKNLKINA